MTFYATKRARPDTCTSIYFLTIRVWETDGNDWDKLVWLMRYITSTRTLPLTLSANGSGILKRSVDVSFTVHPNMQWNPGGGLYVGTGFIIAGSTKHKLNSRRSTETEILGVNDFVPSIFWTKYLLDYKDKMSRIIVCTRTTQIMPLFINDCYHSRSLRSIACWW